MRITHIISNSREQPKKSAFTTALSEWVLELLKEDESLKAIESRRQDNKARKSSSDLSRKLTKFLSSVLSNAAADPDVRAGGNAPGDAFDGKRGNARPEVPAEEPPTILNFVTGSPAIVPEGTARIIKFMSNGRPPKYSFHGPNPRCFAELICEGDRSPQLSISGKADIDGRGYGSVTLSCSVWEQKPVTSEEVIGRLSIKLQTTAGRTLKASLEVGIAPKPIEKKRKRQQSVRPVIRFCAPEGSDRSALASLLHEDEDNITCFSDYLQTYQEALSISERECAYWAEKSEDSGQSLLIVEINAAHPQFTQILKSAKTAEDRFLVKERIVQDIVLDCYQHAYQLDDVPETVREYVVADPDDDDRQRAAEICLNFDKAIRIARVLMDLRKGN